MVGIIDYNVFVMFLSVLFFSSDRKNFKFLLHFGWKIWYNFTVKFYFFDWF